MRTEPLVIDPFKPATRKCRKRPRYVRKQHACVRKCGTADGPQIVGQFRRKLELRDGAREDPLARSIAVAIRQIEEHGINLPKRHRESLTSVRRAALVVSVTVS
jgi:hypothetical protein